MDKETWKKLRKRVKCKKCGKKVNLVYKVKDGRILLTCPNCFAQGDLKIMKKI